ncbi:hypothetical protein EV127DRAFT_492122 [Xylaria flabelliformis]|nr:hypothetical protein EV127DRAFT_492122 [Xylaria flabelliformis]
MSGYYDPTRGPTSGNGLSASSPDTNQPSVAGVVRTHQQPDPNAREHPEARRHTEQHLLSHIQYLEMQLAMKCRFIQDYLLKWFWPFQTSEASLDLELVGINTNTHEVVSKDFQVQSQAELRDLRQALKEKSEECDRVRERWQAAIGELSDTKSSKQVFMVDDADMISKWNQLDYRIKNLAKTYLNNLVSPKRLTQKQAALLESVTPLYQEFLSAEGRVHLLFQSLVWMHTTERILLNPAKVWGENISAVFGILRGVCRDSTDDYHSWRAETGNIIQKARGIHNETELCFKDRLHSVVTQFVPKKILSNEEHKEIIRRSVERIVDQAIEIAVIFNRSRCYYRIGRVIHRERFNPVQMEYDEGCNAPQVDLMISPKLIKVGNSKGEDYDKRLLLVKSRVCTLKRDVRDTDEDGKEDDTNDNGNEK